jgi:hypothetical protein
MTKLMFKIAVGYSSIVTVAIGVFMASNMCVSADEPMLTGEGWIVHDWGERFSIENGVKSIQKGERIGDDCRFTVRLERRPGEPAKIARGFAVNPSTCEKLVEKGILSEEGKQVIRKEESRADGSRDSRQPKLVNSNINTGKRGPGLHAPSLLPSDDASFKTRWEDPVNLDVNWVKSWVEWEYDAPNSKVYIWMGLYQITG